MTAASPSRKELQAHVARLTEALSDLLAAYSAIRKCGVNVPDNTLEANARAALQTEDGAGG